MNFNNLYFFDKFGKSLNLQLDDTLSFWKGTIYFEGISTYLFDNENIFILEKESTLYKFPILSPGEKFEFVWTDNKLSDNFFLYDVEKDIQLKENFISKVESKTIAYEDLAGPAQTSPLDIKFPMQVNIAFSPSDETRFERTLQIYYNDGSASTKIAELKFYGEGVEEEERFRIWAQNFGIKFLKEDANILKDYDIKEAIPDYTKLNQIRKELLVSKEQIYPYIGTYKGLSNFINMLGYKDLLQIKEYWLNINNASTYFNKMLMVDISDYLDDGIIDTLDLVDKNRNIKEGKQFKKTEFLAIVYQFTRATDNYDDDGIPIVEETTEFTVNEIFYKLNLLNDKVKSEFLPINVKIKDIIGEFIYFQKITISSWLDETSVIDYQINESAQINVYPSTANYNLVLRALDPLYNRVAATGIDFGVARINSNTVNPFYNNQQYTKDQIAALKEHIHTFYSEIKDQRYPNLRSHLTWEFGDDPQRIIGAPVIFTIDTNKFTIIDLKGVKLQDLASMSTTSPGISPYWTLANIDFKNYYEVNWRIIKPGPNPYNFEYRGKITDLYELVHFLPYAGKYRVIIELYDLYGNISVFSKYVTVSDAMQPEIVGFTRLEDKFNYQISNLNNVQLEDFGASPLYYPTVTVLNNNVVNEKINIYKNLLEWISFFNNGYGMGQKLYDVELYDDNTNTYLKYTDPAQKHPKKLYWGLGENDTPIKIRDFQNMKIDELFWLRLTNLVYLDDFSAGFYINNPKPGGAIQISLFSNYIIPNFNTLDELVNILNASTHPGIRLFSYAIISGKKKDKQYIIHAQARYLTKEMYHILYFAGGGSPSPALSVPTGGSVKGDKYTFFLPKKVFSKRTVDYLKSLSPIFDEETLFLFAKTSDVLSGAVQDPNFWQIKKYWNFVNDKQIGYLPTTIDQNAFSIDEVKLFEESFIIPEDGIVFFVVNNLDGKSDFIWTLTNYNTGEEIVRAKSVPFFVWKFKDLGAFTLSVRVIDNRGTEYVSTVENFIQVLDRKDYVNSIEKRLNHRKIELLKNRF